MAALAAAWLATRLLGALAARVKQPPVLGELIAGVLLGGSVLGLLDPAAPAVRMVSEVGVIVLLFTIGLETDVMALVRVGGAATMVAVTGVVLPTLTGYFAVVALGLAAPAAIVCGAALCATSVGITARVLSDIKRLESDEGRVILGAAVIDDAIGLVILAMVASVMPGGEASGASIGSAAIVLAFVAGVVLHRLPQRPLLERATKGVGFIVVPLFFATVGAAVDLRALGDAQSLLLGGVLIACGVAGKVAAGFSPWWTRGDKLLVGIGMVPRGEVGLVFAQMGLVTGAVNAGEYGALMLMVLGTTFVTPPALAWRARRLAARAA